MLSQDTPLPLALTGLQPPPAPPAPGALDRMVALLRAGSLDRGLLAGEDPVGCTLLAARSARLTSRRRRDRLADALRGLLRAAAEPPRRARVAPDSFAVARNEGALRQLAEQLEQPGAVYARGVARLERLVSDGTGPAFRGPAGALEAELELARAELRGELLAPADAPPPAGPAARWRRRALRRVARRRPPGGPAAPAGPAGRGSFALPDGSWFHGRRDSA